MDWAENWDACVLAKVGKPYSSEEKIGLKTMELIVVWKASVSNRDTLIVQLPY